MAHGVTVKDNGLKAFIKHMKAAKPTLKVGILSKEAGEPANKSPGLTVLDVACFNEFGGGNTPERSFIRAWCEQKQAEIVETISKQAAIAVKNRTPWETVLERIGLYCVGGMQQRISDGIEPPNADSTIKAKGSDKPLIDTGQLRSSITYVVIPGGK